jgi:chromosome segregation protein
VHLKSIQIQGFKTFAKKTELVFEPGITGIVGPNGSGKSNIVDAVRWVLGERSAKELRGTRMEEVVYSGGARRPASGMAEVRLLLDNSDGRLGVPFQEIEVIRRGYRSGESDYWMNGARCRLRDIEELFSSTGLTQEGYAVVAQDDVDRIIQTSASERRALIEEAAGVRGLHSRRQEAFNKLKEADVSILRLTDLAGELEPRVEALRSQAEAALRHREATAELEQLRGSLLRGEWLAARQAMKKAEGRVQSLTAAVEAADLETNGFAAEYDAHKEKLARAHEARIDLERRMGTLRLAASHAGGRLELLAERLSAADATRADVEAALADAQGRLHALQAEAAAAKQEQVEGAAEPVAEIGAADGAGLDVSAALERQRQAAGADEAARARQQAADTRVSRLEERIALVDSLAEHGELQAPSAARLVRLLQAPGVRDAAVAAGIQAEELTRWLDDGRTEQASLARARAEAEIELVEARDEALTAASVVVAARGQLASAESALEAAREANVERQARLLALSARADTSRARMDRAQAAELKQRAEVLRIEERLAGARRATAALEQDRTAAAAEAATASAELERAPGAAPDPEVESLTARLVELEKGNLERRVALAHQEEALTAATVQLAEAEAALADLTQRMGGAGAEELAGAEVDWEKTQRDITRLERQVAQMGLVNPLAIEEYERDNARLGAISGQLDDLRGAREGLEQVAAELGAEIDRRFEAVFGAVAFNFQETFALLFDGGKATLRLDDPEAEEPGVDILAQPAGKRMRNIRLLSGGERALTALAFILALEKVNPSPFYILDEVDAPLDDANVRRFNTLLRTLADDSQFILVTHNHHTMTHAGALYGVTLEDSGVSRVVSVRLAGGSVVQVSAAAS